MSPALAAEGGFLLGAFSANRKVVRFAPTTTLHAKYDDSHELRQLTPTTTTHAHCHDLRQLRRFAPTAFLHAHKDLFTNDNHSAQPSPRSRRPAPSSLRPGSPHGKQKTPLDPNFQASPSLARPKSNVVQPILEPNPLRSSRSPTASKRLACRSRFKSPDPLAPESTVAPSAAIPSRQTGPHSQRTPG